LSERFQALTGKAVREYRDEVAEPRAAEQVDGLRDVALDGLV
jgi:hypothetical protein